MIFGAPTGDPYGKYATVSGFRNELVKLVARMDEFDGIFPGHGIADLGSIMLDCCGSTEPQQSCFLVKFWDAEQHTRRL